MGREECSLDRGWNRLAGLFRRNYILAQSQIRRHGTPADAAMAKRVQGSRFSHGQGQFETRSGRLHESRVGQNCFERKSKSKRSRIIRIFAKLISTGHHGRSFCAYRTWLFLLFSYASTISFTASSARSSQSSRLLSRRGTGPTIMSGTVTARRPLKLA